MSDIQTNDNGAQKKHSVSFPLILTILAALIVVGVSADYFVKKNKEAKARIEEAMSQEAVPITAGNIIGHYTIALQEEVDEDATNYTGFIDIDAVGACTLHILSEYEPRLLLLDINSDGTVTNDELGIGTMTYKRSIDKTTITFKKGNQTCTLTK